MTGVSKPKIQWAISLFLVMLYFSNLPAQAQYSGGPVEPNFAVYYEPWELHIEPNTVSYELLLDLGVLTNYDHVNRYLALDQAKDLIGQNGFVVIEHEFYSQVDDIVEPYTYLRDDNIPMFVTADTLLHLYHIQFGETLKEIEETEFVDAIKTLTDTLLSDHLQLYDQLEGDLKEAARRNVAYLSVAGQLIGSSSSVPEIVSNEVSSELAKIEL